MKNHYLGYFLIIVFNILFFKKYGGDFFNIIPTSILVIILLVGSFYYYIRVLKSFYFSSLHGIIYLLFFIMYISLFWTNSLHYAIEKIVTFLFTIIIFYLFTPVIYKYFKFYLFISILFYLLYLVDLYLSYGFINELASQMVLNFRLGWDDDDLTLFHPIGIARFISLGLFTLLFTYQLYKRKHFSILFVFLLLFCIGLIYLFFSGTKTPILALVLSVSLYYLVNYFISMYTKIIIILIPIMLVILFYLLFIFNVGLTHNQKVYIEYRFFNPSAAFKDRAYQNNRALDKIDASNLILGTGSGNFSYLYNKKDIRDYPHNIFSELLIENGIISALIVLYLLFIIVKINRYNQSIPIKYFIIIFYYYYINSLFSGDLISNNILFGFFILIINSSFYEKKECLE